MGVVRVKITSPSNLGESKSIQIYFGHLCRRYLAANGAIMRTSILGILNFNGKENKHPYTCVLRNSFILDISKVVANTTEICNVTHADPRCAASCIAVTTAVSVHAA